MSFLAYDGSSLTGEGLRLYEVSNVRGLLRLSQFWKYHLHLTMGRPIIVLNKVWGHPHNNSQHNERGES